MGRNTLTHDERKAKNREYQRTFKLRHPERVAKWLKSPTSKGPKRCYDD